MLEIVVLGHESQITGQLVGKGVVCASTEACSTPFLDEYTIRGYGIAGNSQRHLCGQVSFRAGPLAEAWPPPSPVMARPCRISAVGGTPASEQSCICIRSNLQRCSRVKMRVDRLTNTCGPLGCLAGRLQQHDLGGPYSKHRSIGGQFEKVRSSWSFCGRSTSPPWLVR